jgi:hypothetical protein
VKIAYSLICRSESILKEKFQGWNQKNTGFPRIKYGASLVKPGMTNSKKLDGRREDLLLSLGGDRY